MNAKERREALAEIPWVIQLYQTGDPCEGIRWGEVTLTELYGKNKRGITPEEREANLQKHKCKKIGHWRYKALKGSGVKSGTYCMSHLIYHCLRDVDEETRYKKWKAKHDG
jgi:hypothetical protein